MIYTKSNKTKINQSSNHNLIRKQDIQYIINPRAI
ncbi:hypothetical protein EMIT0111MI5_90106 [Burkholderia sp. IT-111MI5]